MFKLLALRVLNGCADYIQKCLQPDVYYYFCTDYRFEKEGWIYRGSKYAKPLSKDFFRLYNELAYMDTESSSINVNINAIVGKNGDGKSTIVELLIRIVHNFIALQQEKGQFAESNTLEYIHGVDAELYFQIDNGIYKLYVQPSKEGGLKRLAEVIDDINTLSFRIREEDATEVFSTIYTFVSNYSHYAYNVRDFRKEWNSRLRPKSEWEENRACWLFNIFHKNDGYLMPLALHPYRETGKIDINKEADLAKQRVLRLFVKPTENHNAFLDVLGKRAVGIRLKPIPPTKSKYYERTIKDYFEVNQTDDASLDWAINIIHKELSEYKEALKQGKSIVDYLGRISILCKQDMDILHNVFECIFEGRNFKPSQRPQYTAFVRFITSTLRQNYQVEKSNIYSYIDAASELYNFIDGHIPEHHFAEIRGHYYDKKTLKNYLNWYGQFNLSQLMRLHTIYTVAINLKIDLTLLTKTIETLTLKEQAQLYKVYKAISIYEKYPNYQRQILPRAKKLYFDLCFEYTEEEHKKLFNQLKSDIKEESHITLKIALIDNYLSKKGDLYDIKDLDSSLCDDESRVKPLSCFAEYYKTDKIDLFHLVPPVFEYSIVFKDGESYIEQDTLSSGEKQLLNTIGAILYHLQNIDMSTTATYDSVNLILEEIELYFHPEYQRQFVNRLLEQIYGANLKTIKNINITFVTHSPFVLSDIPKCNVLFLKDGKPDYSMQENTFGANIHSLLKNGFFLPNLPMGEFAYRKINDLFGRLNAVDFKAEEVAELRQEIALIGEPYLREELFRLLRNH